MPRQSFERFYYTKVGLGEGCGCAEFVTRTRDLDDLATKRAMRGVRADREGWVRRAVRWATGRRKPASAESANPAE